MLTALWLTGGLLATGGPVELIPTGDGGGVRVTVTNASVHPLTLAVAPRGGEAAPLGPLPGYGTQAFTAHCVEAGSDVPPAMELRLDRQKVALDVPRLHFEGGPPAIRIADEGGGSAVLDSVLAAVGVERVVRRTPAEMPTTFGALRFAPFIVAAVPDVAALTPAARRALEQSVAAGVTLVLATGEGAGPVGVSPGAGVADLTAWLGITLGDTVHPGPAARAAVPRAVALRHLAFAEGGLARARVVADGRPLLVEVPWGLGRVRVLAVALDELESGPLVQAAFERGPDPAAPLAAWLNAQPPLEPAGRPPLRAWIWAALGTLVALALLARRWPRLAAAGVLPLLGTSVALSPGGAPVQGESARMVAVPAGKGALVLGTVDVAFGRGGAWAIPAGPGPLAIDDARPGGGCLVTGPAASDWILPAAPGASTRLRFLAFSDAAPSTGPLREEHLPDLGGPWAGAALRTLDTAPVSPLGAEVGLATVEAVWAVPAPSEAVAPQVLPVPATEPPDP